MPSFSCRRNIASHFFRRWTGNSFFPVRRRRTIYPFFEGEESLHSFLAEEVALHPILLLQEISSLAEEAALHPSEEAAIHLSLTVEATLLPYLADEAQHFILLLQESSSSFSCRSIRMLSFTCTGSSTLSFSCRKRSISSSTCKRISTTFVIGTLQLLQENKFVNLSLQKKQHFILLLQMKQHLGMSLLQEKTHFLLSVKKYQSYILNLKYWSTYFFTCRRSSTSSCTFFVSGWGSTSVDSSPQRPAHVQLKKGHFINTF